ncbi:MAG: anthranilate synthase component I, partial [Candidatus Thiodiazotropha taylori]
MTPQEFNALVEQGYNRIPVVCEVLADLDTPLSVYMKLANGPYSYLFESVQGGEKWGRYSIIGLPCRTHVRIYDKQVEVVTDGAVIEQHQVEDPLAWVETFQQRYRAAELEGLPRFNGGLVGYFGYDIIRYIEPKLADSANPDQLNTPDILLMVSDEVVVFDNLSGRLYVIVHVDPDNGGSLDTAQARIVELIRAMRQPVPKLAAGEPRQVDEADFVSGFTEQGYKQAVERIKQYILDGDCMQVVVSQRLSIPFQA